MKGPMSACSKNQEKLQKTHLIDEDEVLVVARKLAEEHINLFQRLGELAVGWRKARARANAEARCLAEENSQKGAQESSNTVGAVETVGTADAQEPSLHITSHSKVGVAPKQSRNEARQAGALAHLEKRTSKFP